MTPSPKMSTNTSDTQQKGGTTKERVADRHEDCAEGNETPQKHPSSGPFKHVKTSVAMDRLALSNMQVVLSVQHTNDTKDPLTEVEGCPPELNTGTS